jgi:aspartyl-tRNA(Asn)/glutamyl-tRNA(Gln) amidotransferase subunit B
MPCIATIGLEIHCQVGTRTKMFCACRTSFGEEPNTLTCPVCLGLPGALPVLNREAISKTLVAGLMLRCSSPEVSSWDRKNYFYPDMPKNYQTTQLGSPLCIGGGIPLYEHCYPTDHRRLIANPGKVVRLNRIHLEEDVAKSSHAGNNSLIDFNRAGTPLMEIVTEPDVDSPEEAFACLRSLQMILQQGGVSDADMEKGQLRCDVNVSVRRNHTDPLGPKVELKNLNSISAVRRALHYEIARQSQDLEQGVIQIQSTRRWDDDRGESQLMRTKEDAHDYRYFACPDLLPVRTAPILETLRPHIPELPHEAAARFSRDFGVTAYDASVLSSDRALSVYFEAIVAAGAPPKPSANFLLNTLLGSLNERGTSIENCPLPATATATLLGLVDDGTLAPNQAREVLDSLLAHPAQDPLAAATALGFGKSSAGELEALVGETIANHPAEAEAVRAGNAKLLNFLTGKVMQAAATKPNPKSVTELLRHRLLPPS